MTYELLLTPRRAARATIPILSGFLIDLGIAADSLVEQEAGGTQRVAVYLSSKTDATRWWRRIRASNLRGVIVRLRAWRDADWQDRWKRHVRPFQITPGLRLVPAWSPEAARGPDARRIVLETGLAFGTGQHPTTKWMAQFIERLRGRFEDVLDVGLGTGILAVVASRCGARRIVGVDLEREAVDVSRRNLVVNGCWQATLLHDDVASVALPHRFDLVVANLGTRELLAVRRKLIAAVRPSKYLAVTGIGRDHAVRFRREFEDRRLRCLRIKTGPAWAGFLYQKRAIQ